MDERHVHVTHGQPGPVRLRQVSPRGLHMDGGREYQLLLEEGHYRCPCCRRADVHEINMAVAYRR